MATRFFCSLIFPSNHLIYIVMASCNIYDVIFSLKNEERLITIQ